MEKLTLKNFILFLLLFLSVACGTIRQVTPREQTTVEIRTETVYVPDTVYIEIPQIVEKVQTLDTVSVLENRYAVSEASVAGNVLKHSLEVKPVKEPVAIQKEIIYRDSIVLQQVDVDHYIEVPAELTPWQSFKIKLGGYAFALILILIVCATIYIIIHLNLESTLKSQYFSPPTSICEWRPVSINKKSDVRKSATYPSRWPIWQRKSRFGPK